MVKYCSAKGCRNKHKNNWSCLCNECQEKNKKEDITVSVLVDKDGKRVCTYE